jgi:hypothetical protein
VDVKNNNNLKRISERELAVQSAEVFYQGAYQLSFGQGSEQFPAAGE